MKIIKVTKSILKSMTLAEKARLMKIIARNSLKVK